MCVCENWRRERDSNPRDGSPPTRVPGVRLKPLGHLSPAPSAEGARNVHNNTRQRRAVRLKPLGHLSSAPPRKVQQNKHRPPPPLQVSPQEGKQARTITKGGAAASPIGALRDSQIVLDARHCRALHLCLARKHNMPVMKTGQAPPVRDAHDSAATQSLQDRRVKHGFRIFIER